MDEVDPLSVRDENGPFSVSLDMNHFRLSEMSVKLVDNLIVVVEAKHGLRPDAEYGSITRHFLHRYKLPSDIDPGSLVSDLSDKGILTITAEKEGETRGADHSDSEEVLNPMALDDDDDDDDYDKYDVDYDETRYIIDDYEHPNSGIYYTVTRVPGKSAPDSLHEQFESGCLCGDGEDCTDNGACSCIGSGPNYERRDDGQLVARIAAKFGDDSPVFECNFRCRCFGRVARSWDGTRGSLTSSCGNRCVQFGPAEDLEIFLTRGKGLGLRTRRNLPRGAFVCEYAGEVVGLHEAKVRLARNDASADGTNYVFVAKEHFVGRDPVVTCVDPAAIGNVGRYVNHGCQPNAAVFPVRVNNAVPKLCIFAIRDVEPGEEICFDYSGCDPSPAAESPPDRKRKSCFCGAEICRKWLPSQNL